MTNAANTPANTAATADKIAELFPASNGNGGNVGQRQNSQNSRVRSNGVTDPNFVSATVFLNPGITIPVKNRITGEITREFVAIPKGLGLDNMEEAEEKGTPEWVRTMKARNKALRKLKALGAALAPGEVLQYSDTLQIRKQADAAPAIVEEEDDLLSSMEEFFAE